MRKEDYNVITPDNKVWNFQKWIENPNYDTVNDISENPYPVMYVEGKAVWEGDKLIFNGMDYGSMNDDNYPEGKPYQTLREVKWNHRGIIRSNKVWVNHWSWSIKPKVM
jgi:hypothetical protein